VYHVKESKRLQATPLVVDGVMYISHTNEVYALDARTGREIWHFKYTQAKRQDGNRGVAVFGGRVFVVSSDAHLLALHAKTGALLWDREYGGYEQNSQIGATLAPLAIDGKVIVGISGGDCGVRGFVDAYDAATGKQLWRFYTIPGPGEPGFETWGGHPIGISGGGTWMTGTYDARQNLLFWTVGNPGPDFYGESRPGDNLYSDSVVALDAGTGKLSSGITSSRLTTRTIGTRRNFRSSSTRPFRANNENCWFRPIAMGSFTFWIVPMERCCLRNRS